MARIWENALIFVTFKFSKKLLSDCKPDQKWLWVNTSKNVGKLSSLKFLLQVIKDNYDPDHSQKTSGYDPSYNSANKLFKVTKKDIIIEKSLRWFGNRAYF